MRSWRPSSRHGHPTRGVSDAPSGSSRGFRRRQGPVVVRAARRRQNPSRHRHAEGSHPRSRRSRLFLPDPELLRLVRETFNRGNDETEMDILRPVLEADLLVLDDLGAEKTSEWVQETLGLVINTRYNAQRATIFTSNLVDASIRTTRISATLHVAARRRARVRGWSKCANGSKSKARTSAMSIRISERPRPARWPKTRRLRLRTLEAAVARQGHGTGASEGFRRSVRTKLVGWESRKQVTSGRNLPPHPVLRRDLQLLQLQSRLT